MWAARTGKTLPPRSRSIKRKREDNQDAESKEKDVEKALTLYDQGWTTRNQLAEVVGVPTKSLNNWLVKKIQEEAKKMSSIMNKVLSDPTLLDQLKNLEDSDSEDTDNSFSSEKRRSEDQEQSALALYHQRQISREELALRVEVPIDSLDDFLALDIKRGLKNFSSQAKLLLTSSASTGWSVKKQKTADSRESSIFITDSDSDSSVSGVPAVYKTNNNSVHQNNNVVESDKMKPEKNKVKKKEFLKIHQ